MVILCASAIALVLGGCYARNDQSRGENGDKELASKPLSPEQCAANANIEASASEDADYRIQQGDILSLDFYLNPEFNDKNVKVDPDGKIVLRMVGPVQAAGLTPSQLASSIDKAYINELRNPGAVVHLNSMPNRQIYVEGEVAKPGAFPLQPGMTAVEALALAGGVTVDSAPNKTVLIRRDACGQPEGTKVDLASAIKEAWLRRRRRPDVARRSRGAAERSLKLRPVDEAARTGRVAGGTIYIAGVLVGSVLFVMVKLCFRTTTRTGLI